MKPGDTIIIEAFVLRERGEMVAAQLPDGNYLLIDRQHVKVKAEPEAPKPTQPRPEPPKPDLPRPAEKKRK